MERAVAALREAGCTVGDAPVPEMAECTRLYGQIQGPEARAVHADRVANAPELFQREVLERLTNAAEVRGWEYVAAMRARARLRPLFPDQVGADVLLLPTVPIEPPPVGARDTDLGAGWTNPTFAVLTCNTTWSVLGLPAISVPMPGDGLPGSVELVGRAGADDQLLAVAALLAGR
jgi:aspartyl-tRNA(Asn)/glutamyl-tRNA(Gln) amidotransferase subunit A